MFVQGKYELNFQEKLADRSCYKWLSNTLLKKVFNTKQLN